MRKQVEMKMGQRTVMESPIGFLELTEENGAVTKICFMKNCKCAQGEYPGGQNNESEILKEAVLQLEEYFAGERKEFSVPLAPHGTEFQKKIWEVLTQIPYGETRSYGEIAQMAGNPKACRAVGMANHNNPIPILIPCHRVIGKNGKLTGYAGGLEKKTALLELERSGKQSVQI